MLTQTNLHVECPERRFINDEWQVRQSWKSAVVFGAGITGKHKFLANVLQQCHRALLLQWNPQVELLIRLTISNPITVIHH